MACPAVTIRDGDWWIGWFEEVPGVNCQERTREDLLDSLKATLAEALNFDRPDNIENPARLLRTSSRVTPLRKRRGITTRP